MNKAQKNPRYDQLTNTGGKPWPQGGLMGLALHPQLLSGKPYVYIAYLYHFAGANSHGNGCLPQEGGCFFTTRLARYDAQQGRLTHPLILCDTLPGSSNHNAGRLLIAPVKGKLFLFYGVGDMGADQFDNAGRMNQAQRTNVYEGKILRFHTEPSTDTGVYSRWIPADNPFGGTRKNAIWSYGHRNAQGLAYAVIHGRSRIYSSEHGPFSDDEINLIEKGKNYGHPMVISYADGNYNQLSAGASHQQYLPGTWHTSCPLIGSEQSNVQAIGSSLYRNTIKSLYPTPHDSLLQLLTNIRDSSTFNGSWCS